MVACNDPTNEIHDITFNPATGELSISDGSTVTIPLGGGGGGTDDQTLTFSGTSLSIEDGNSVDLSGLQVGVEDADADPTNELQTIGLAGKLLSLSSGGGSVDLTPIIPDEVWTRTVANDIYYGYGGVGIRVTDPEDGVGLHLGDDLFWQSDLGKASPSSSATPTTATGGGSLRRTPAETSSFAVR